MGKSIIYWSTIRMRSFFVYFFHFLSPLILPNSAQKYIYEYIFFKFCEGAWPKNSLSLDSVPERHTVTSALTGSDLYLFLNLNI